MALIFLHIGIFIVAFLVMLNGQLHGRAKSTVDAVLSVLWLALLLTILLAVGWKATLVALGASFVYAAIASPPARLAARWLLSHPPQ